MNRLNQILAGFGVAMLALLLEIALTHISTELTYSGLIIAIYLEWVYICELQNKNKWKTDN